MNQVHSIVYSTKATGVNIEEDHKDITISLNPAYDEIVIAIAENEGVNSTCSYSMAWVKQRIAQR